MGYFDGILKQCREGYRESSPQLPADSCMVFDMAKGTRLVASRMRAGITPPASLSSIMPKEEFVYLTEYLGSYAERPTVVSTLLGWAVVITILYPSTSLCVLSIADIGGENFLRVAKNQKWELSFSPAAIKRQLRSTGIREGHVEESVRLWRMLCDCFSPFPDTAVFGCSPRDVLETRALAIAEYVSRRARITLERSLFASAELDLPLYVAFLLLLMLNGRASKAEECAKISVFDHSHGVEVVIVEKSGRERARVTGTFSAVCGRGNIPFEYFCEDGRILARIVPIRVDWAYLGIKSPDKE